MQLFKHFCSIKDCKIKLMKVDIIFWVVFIEIALEIYFLFCLQKVIFNTVKRIAIFNIIEETERTQKRNKLLFGQFVSNCLAFFVFLIG